MVRNVLCLFLSVVYVYAATTRRPIVEEIRQCIDTMEDCKRFDLKTICKGYRNWSEINCRKSCGFCSEIKGCKDTVSECSAYLWMADDFCNSQKIFAELTCPATCNVCKEKETCIDVFPHCQAYHQMYSVCNFDSTYRQWAEKNCKVTCGICQIAGKMAGQDLIG